MYNAKKNTKWKKFCFKFIKDSSQSCKQHRSSVKEDIVGDRPSKAIHLSRLKMNITYFIYLVLLAVVLPFVFDTGENSQVGEYSHKV